MRSSEIADYVTLAGDTVCLKRRDALGSINKFNTRETRVSGRSDIGTKIAIGISTLGSPGWF